jgi:ATP-dependent DNA helicase RecQ
VIVNQINDTLLSRNDKRILLIDDIFDSGSTIKEIGSYLTKAGAVVIAPLVIARTVGGDI